MDVSEPRVTTIGCFSWSVLSAVDRLCGGGRRVLTVEGEDDLSRS